jgi:Peptidase propeptide and YPEB domain
MVRFSSALLAGAFLAATAGMALAADSGGANRMTEALNLLEAQGYGSFSNFKADGANYEATVSQNGKSFTVVINPDSGQVTRQG